MTTKEQVIAWSEQADDHADKTLQCQGEYHPDWHEVRDAYFATLVRNAVVIEERMALAQLCDAMGSPQIAEYLRAQAEIIRKEPTT